MSDRPVSGSTAGPASPGPVSGATGMQVLFATVVAAVPATYITVPQLTPPPYVGSMPVGAAGAQAGADGMADAALTKQVEALGKQIEALAAAIQPTAPSAKPPQFWKRVDVYGVLIGALTLMALVLTALGVEGRFGAVDKRIDDLAASVNRLDDRLTPAINNLSAQIAALDKREAVDVAAKSKGH